RGLMPNPKTGTVTMDVARAVEEIKGGKIEFRVDKHANLHFIIGKTSFTDAALVQNYAAALDEVLRLKPSAAKGRYLRKATATTTPSPRSTPRARPPPSPPAPRRRPTCPPTPPPRCPSRAPRCRAPPSPGASPPAPTTSARSRSTCSRPAPRPSPAPASPRAAA